MTEPQRYGCPVCGCVESQVVDTRRGKSSIRRRRVCGYGHRFTTREYVVEGQAGQGVPPRMARDMDGVADAVGVALLSLAE